MRHAWDGLTDLVAKWERRLEREGLGVIKAHNGHTPEKGRHDQFAAEFRGRAVVNVEPRLARAGKAVPLYSDLTSQKIGQGEFAAISSWDSFRMRHVENQIAGSIWDMSAAFDRILCALHRYPFAAKKDRRICELLSERVPWHRIAVKLRCSKRRISRVHREVQAWRDPESEAA